MTLNNKTKEKIIKETTKLIQKHGYTETNLQDIIKKSKSPKGSLYHYFPKGKDDIIISSLDNINMEFNKKFQNSIDKNSTLKEILESLLMVFKTKERSYGTPSFRLTLLALETIGQAPEVSKKCGEIVQEWRNTLSETIENIGLNKITSQTISTWFFSILQGAICASVIHKDTTHMDIVESSIKLIENLNEEQLKVIFSPK
ncbi:TetR/AcrR family transcriptional regulator [Gemella sp. GH3]|uniref:TetR/AcrR family transcriptional regulator n=1 Tax=unclassified Gemella TaxID=2624949 RepID=UPI0015CF9201|nr:TetR/AcrR family transcriptional regulator [Gemella sp. GH3.1]NYS50630.1 TetR/AcrR family transcriptional regulator [Gemella sp. GH3]